MDPMMLMGLLQMGMGGMQSATNTAMGSIPMLVSMWDRVRARTDPLMRQLGGVIADRYNQSVTENPYGDPYGAWGGMFGEHDDGSAIGFGEAQARAIQAMMGANPAASTIENYMQLAQAQRPEVSNTAANLDSFMGRTPQESSYRQVHADVKAPDAAAYTRSNFEGAPAPRDNSSQTVDPRLASGGPLARLMGAAQLSGGATAGGGNQGATGGNGLMSHILPALLQANQSYNGGYGTGGLMRHAAGQRFPMLAQALPSFAVGTNYVPHDMVAKIHQGEMIVPASQNPMAKAGAAWNNVPQGGVSGGMNSQGGGVSGGMQGGAPAQAQNPQSLMQQIIAQGGQAITPQMQQQMVTAGTDNLQNEYGAMQRQAYNQNAMMGGVGGMVPQSEMSMFLAGKGNALKRDVGIQAANTNWQSLLGGAGLQLQGEQAATQANQWQQQFEQNLYNQDISQWANIFNAINAAGQQGQGQQLGLWDRLQQLGQQGINQSTPFLSNLMNLAQWRISPSGVQAGPMQTGGMGIPFYGGGGGGYGGGGGGGGGGQSWDQLASALGYWAGSGFPGMQ